MHFHLMQSRCIFCGCVPDAGVFPMQHDTAGISQQALSVSYGTLLHAVFARHFTEQELKGNGASPKSEPSSSKAALRTNSFAPTKAAPPSSEGTSKSRFNIIERSRWPNGIPAVMGAHLMASGIIAPLSTSKGQQSPKSSSATIREVNTFKELLCPT